MLRPSLPRSAGPSPGRWGPRHPGMSEIAAVRRQSFDRAGAKRAAGHNYKQMNDLSKDAVNWLAVGEDGQGQRVDNYLVKILKGVPKSHVYRILRSGEVRVNRRKVGPDTRLNVGDQLRIPPIRASSPARKSPTVGLARSRDPADPVRGRRADRARQAGRPRRPRRQRHRLRRHRAAAPGAARRAVPRARAPARPRHVGRAAHREEAPRADGAARAAARRRDRQALHGAGPRQMARRDARGRAAADDLRDRRRRAARPRGRERAPRADDLPPGHARGRAPIRRSSLLDAELETGRTHQIRVHLTHLGFPLAGDDKYGDFAWNRRWRDRV